MRLTRIGLVDGRRWSRPSPAVYALFQAFDAAFGAADRHRGRRGSQAGGRRRAGRGKRTGRHELPPGSRVNDAILAAGGLNPEADLSTINLARRLRDEEVVVILQLPRAGEQSETAAIDGGEGAGASDIPVRININTATLAELDLLPGVGEVTAERIVQFREENGPYRSVDDLIHVQGISDRTIDGFRDQVTVGP